MTSPENPGRDGYPRSRHDLDQALENRLRIRTDYLGSCVVIALLLAAIPPSVVIDLVRAENFIRAGESDDAWLPMSDFVVLNDRRVATTSAVVAA